MKGSPLHGSPWKCLPTWKCLFCYFFWLIQHIYIYIYTFFWQLKFKDLAYKNVKSDLIIISCSFQNIYYIKWPYFHPKHHNLLFLSLTLFTWTFCIFSTLTYSRQTQFWKKRKFYCGNYSDDLYLETDGILLKIQYFDHNILLKILN